MSFGHELGNYAARQIGCLVFAALIIGGLLALGGWWLVSHLSISFAWS